MGCSIQTSNNLPWFLLFNELYSVKCFEIRFQLAKKFYLCQWIRDNQTELEKAYKATVPNGNDNDLQLTDIGSDDVSSLEEKKTFLFSLIDEDWSKLRFM